jgi:hypothetical protein
VDAVSGEAATEEEGNSVTRNIRIGP